MEQYINRITCADCLDILKQLPDKCVKKNLDILILLLYYINI